MKFARPAPWLRTLFPPSVAPFDYVGDLNDSVQLVHPFGDGYSLDEPTSWWSEAGPFTVSGAEQLFDIGSVRSDEIVRLLGVVCRLSVTGFQWNIELLAAPQNAAATNFVANLYGPLTQFVQSGTLLTNVNVPVTSPIIGPGQFILLHTSGGVNGGTIQVKMYFVAAPLGSIYFV